MHYYYNNNTKNFTCSINYSVNSQRQISRKCEALFHTVKNSDHTVSSDHSNEFEMWKVAVVYRLETSKDQGNSQNTMLRYSVIEARYEVAVARINLKERDHLGDPGVDGKTILRWIFRKWDVGVSTGSSWLRIGKRGGHL